MSTAVPPLKDYLAEIPEFRKAKGQRYALLSLLLYVCVAMLGGLYWTITSCVRDLTSLERRLQSSDSFW